MRNPLIILCIFACLNTVCAQPHPVSESLIREKFKNVYKQFEKADPGKHTHLQREIPANEEVNLGFFAESRILRYLIDAKPNVRYEAVTGKLISAYDVDLSKLHADYFVDRNPRLSISEAISKARSYVEAFGLQLPDTAELDECRFGAGGGCEWRIFWTRKYGPYKGNKLGGEKIHDTIGVRFHEKHGLIAFFDYWNGPAPQTLEVKLTQKDALRILDKVFPEMEKTRIYQRGTDGTMVISTIISSGLAVSVPNWGMDPARAEPVPTKPIEERRLCWVIQALLVETDAGKSIQPLGERQNKELTVSIDAATGEVVRIYVDRIFIE